MKATMESFFADETPMATSDCEVVLRADEIVISYDDGPEVIIWKGSQSADGHFDLACPEVRGRATLHRAPGRADSLEGSWTEEGHQGMWRIDLETENRDSP